MDHRQEHPVLMVLFERTHATHITTSSRCVGWGAVHDGRRFIAIDSRSYWAVCSVWLKSEGNEQTHMRLEWRFRTELWLENTFEPISLAFVGIFICIERTKNIKKDGYKLSEVFKYSSVQISYPHLKWWTGDSDVPSAYATWKIDASHFAARTLIACAQRAGDLTAAAARYFSGAECVVVCEGDRDTERESMRRTNHIISGICYSEEGWPWPPAAGNSEL